MLACLCMAVHERADIFWGAEWQRDGEEEEEKIIFSYYIT